MRLGEYGSPVRIMKFNMKLVRSSGGRLANGLMILIWADQERGGKGVKALFSGHSGCLAQPYVITDSAPGDIPPIQKPAQDGFQRIIFIADGGYMPSGGIFLEGRQAGAKFPIGHDIRIKKECGGLISLSSKRLIRPDQARCATGM